MATARLSIQRNNLTCHSELESTDGPDSGRYEMATAFIGFSIPSTAVVWRSNFGIVR
ncbi:hypothetical protein JMUB7489_26930 [Staphylococcus aureus]